MTAFGPWMRSGALRFQNLLGLVCAGLVAMPALAADNYVFYGGVPLMTVAKDGAISPLALGVDDGRQMGHSVVDKRIARRIKTLWTYPEEGKPSRVELVGVKIDNSVGCTEGDSIQVQPETVGLLTTIPLGRREAAPLPARAETLKRVGRQLLDKALADAGVGKAWRGRLQELAAIRPLRLRAGQRESLIVTANDEWKERSITVFLIAEPDQAGRYAFTGKTVRLGSPSDSEGYAGTHEYLEHADVTGDGIAEIFIVRSAYESFDTSVLQWDGQKWEIVAGAGGGC